MSEICGSWGGNGDFSGDVCYHVTDVSYHVTDIMLNVFHEQSHVIQQCYPRMAGIILTISQITNLELGEAKPHM